MESAANLFNGTRDAFQIEATDGSNDVDAASTSCHKQIILRNTVAKKLWQKNFIGKMAGDKSSIF